MCIWFYIERFIIVKVYALLFFCFLPFYFLSFLLYFTKTTKYLLVLQNI